MNLNFILLDGAQGSIVIPFFLIAHIVFTFFVEGGILRYFNYGTYKKCFTDAFIINLCSLIIGLFLAVPFYNLTRSVTGYPYSWEIPMLLGLFYIQTIICEGLILHWLNRAFPIKKLVIATLLMNLCTYLALYLILETIG